MCSDATPAHHVHDPGVFQDVEPRVALHLEPVDSVTVTTLMDNVTDALMPDQGPAPQPLPGASGQRPAATMAGGQAPEALLAEHGFSVLVSITKNAHQHHILFDAGTSPDGVSENMRRLDMTPP
jgi:7,8-dihydropterin-6-yl-methyl-4-(beta-D-ribofuranosyl)aminobenzene 5'-phosphate synthase